MRWKWCEMCQFDGHCQNQDAGKECACYAREQTLRAEQYSNVIDELDKRLKKTQELELEVRRENAKLKSRLDFITTASDFDISRMQDDCKILAKKLLEVKPELEDWLNANFGEYL